MVEADQLASQNTDLKQDTSRLKMEWIKVTLMFENKYSKTCLKPLKNRQNKDHYDKW